MASRILIQPLASLDCDPETDTYRRRATFRIHTNSEDEATRTRERHIADRLLTSAELLSVRWDLFTRSMLTVGFNLRWTEGIDGLVERISASAHYPHGSIGLASEAPLAEEMPFSREYHFDSDFPQLLPEISSGLFGVARLVSQCPPHGISRNVTTAEVESLEFVESLIARRSQLPEAAWLASRQVEVIDDNERMMELGAILQSALQRHQIQGRWQDLFERDNLR